MKEYSKEKLHEYAKELFALCLEKGLFLSYNSEVGSIDIYSYIDSQIVNIGYTYISEKSYNFSYDECMPIWKLIEKVKQL